MIVTLTPNPSIDQTISISELTPGRVHRASAITQVAGGKGVNVSIAMKKAGVPTIAILPADPEDEFLRLMAATKVATFATAATGPVRINVAVTEADGCTTKLNGPGPAHDAATAKELMEALKNHSRNASWFVLAGSLPRGLDEGFYPLAIKAIRSANPDALVAVDTSDQPLESVAAAIAAGQAPDLIKPNGEELGQILGKDGLALEERAEAGDIAPVVAAAQELVAQGLRYALITLGGAGAVLASEEGCWHARAPRITVASTVGAGDSALSGFLIAHSGGKPLAECLKLAVAYGSIAASLPGTTIPGPDDIPAEFLAGITVNQVD